MRSKNLKRALCLLLALAAVFTLAPLPGSASRFNDVSDKRMARAADVLSALGVVGGTGGGTFTPEGRLTRAELCKMAVQIMGMGDKVQAQSFRTIFRDMGTHWARGYVNLAAVTEVEGSRLMLGLGNGEFGPDREVTYQEAATLALRILGYGEEANRVWPYGALETVGLLGLDEGLDITAPSAPITRGQTALLFYQLLSTPAKGEEEPYAHNLGRLEEGSILLANNATVNGKSGWIVTARDGATNSYPSAAPVDSSLIGLRGWAMLDQEGKFVTLLPDESSFITGVVSQQQARFLHLYDYGRYTLSDSTPVYTGTGYDAKVTTYKEYRASLRPGDPITIYLDSQGRAAGLFRAEASDESDYVVVRKVPVSYETFRSITGDTKDYTIRKNGSTVTMREIGLYDVATFDPITRVLDVCDVRLTCVYENAEPAPAAPSKITAAGGNKFDVMANAVIDFADMKLGDSMTLLLTANGRVAGLMDKRDKTTSVMALGILTDGGFELLGCKKTLDVGKVTNLEEVGQGDILNAASAERGTLQLELAGTQVFAQFKPVEMRLDKTMVSEDVRVYERTADGLKMRSLSELPSSVTAFQYHKGKDGLVDMIILGAYSGDGLEYGRIDMGNGYKMVQMGSNQWLLVSIQGMRFTTSKNSYEGLDVGSRLFPSGYGAVIKEGNRVLGVNYLQEIKNVPSSAFFIQNGETYVSTGSGIYLVDENVLCINAAASYVQPSSQPEWVRWMLQEGGSSDKVPAYIKELAANDGYSWIPNSINPEKFKSLGECRNFTDTLTVYVDNVGKRVRVVEAK